LGWTFVSVFALSFCASGCFFGEDKPPIEEMFSQETVALPYGGSTVLKRIETRPTCPLNMVPLGVMRSTEDRHADATEVVNRTSTGYDSTQALALAQQINNFRFERTKLRVYGQRALRASPYAVVIRLKAQERESECFEDGRCVDRIKDWLQICVPNTHFTATKAPETINFCTWAHGDRPYYPTNNFTYKLGVKDTPRSSKGSTTSCNADFVNPGLKRDTIQFLSNEETANLSTSPIYGCAPPSGAEAQHYIVKATTEITPQLQTPLWGADIECSRTAFNNREHTGSIRQFCCVAEINYDVDRQNGVTAGTGTADTENDIYAWYAIYRRRLAVGDGNGDGWVRTDDRDFLMANLNSTRASQGLIVRPNVAAFANYDLDAANGVTSADEAVYTQNRGRYFAISADDLERGDLNLDGRINVHDYDKLMARFSLNPANVVKTGIPLPQ
jgi:hypothetical protein